MPAWITHIVTANKILEKVKVEDENSFIFGNILPDINNAYFVKDAQNVLGHKETHFTRDEDLKEKSFNYYNIDRFKNEYKEKLNDSLILGYLVHILTDSYWNEIVYNEHYIYDEDKKFSALKLYNEEIIECDKYTATKTKQKDFNEFSNYLLSKNRNINLPYYTDKLVKEADLIVENPITDTDIKEAINCLENMIEVSKVDKKYKYQLFTCEELEEKFKNSIEEIARTICTILYTDCTT